MSMALQAVPHLPLVRLLGLHLHGRSCNQAGAAEYVGSESDRLRLAAATAQAGRRPTPAPSQARPIAAKWSSLSCATVRGGNRGPRRCRDVNIASDSLAPPSFLFLRSPVGRPVLMLREPARRAAARRAKRARIIAVMQEANGVQGGKMRVELTGSPWAWGSWPQCSCATAPAAACHFTAGLLGGVSDHMHASAIRLLPAD